MQIDPDSLNTKYVTFHHWQQFETDSRGLLKHHRPFIPSGYPYEVKTETGTALRQKFEQRGPRLTYEMVDFHLDKLIKTMELCLV